MMTIIQFKSTLFKHKYEKTEYNLIDIRWVTSQYGCDHPGDC